MLWKLQPPWKLTINMAFTIFTSSDSGAPVLNGMTGSLISLLDACLVNGYGDKSGLGWTKEYTSGTCAAVYRMPTGIRFYLQVNNTDAVNSGNSYLRGFQSMTSYESGVNQFPNSTYDGWAAGNINYSVWNTQFGAVSNPPTFPVTWKLFGDGLTFYLFTKNIVVDGLYYYHGHGFGEFYSYKRYDAYRCFIIGRPTIIANTNVAANAYGLLVGRKYDLSYLGGHILCKDVYANASPVMFGKMGNPVYFSPDSAAQETGPLHPMCGNLSFPCSINGGFMASPIFIFETDGTMRGEMRGLWHWCHWGKYVSDGLVLSGQNELNGKIFHFVAPGAYYDYNLASWGGVGNFASGTVSVGMVETSDTIPYNPYIP